MNRDEFMNKVEYLLSDFPEEETRDALDYYRDYLEEAGDSAEEAMREFGSPERIASIIRSDIQGNLADGGEFTDTGYTDERFREPNYQLARRERDASDSSDGTAPENGRQPAYGNAEGDQNVSGRENAGTAGQIGDRNGGYFGSAGQSGAAGQFGSAGQSGAAGQSGNAGRSGTAGQSGNAGRSGAPGQPGYAGQPGAPGQPGSSGRPATKVLWIILAVIGAAAILPSLLGFAGYAFGILVAIVVILFVLIFLAAILTLVFLVAGVAVVAAGIAAAFADPLDGVACIGLGLVLLAVGLVGVVLSVLIYGKLLPWLFRGAIDGLNGMLHRKERTA